MNRNRLACVMAAGSMLVLAPALQAQTADATFERSFAVEGPFELDVATGSGDVIVRSGAADTATVRGRLVIHERGGGFAFWRRGSRLSDEEIADLIREFETEPPVDFSGRRLRVGHHDHEWNHGFSVSYDIEVPQSTDVRSRTGSGRMEVDGIHGSVEARTGSGGVTLRDIVGDVEASSGSGSIRAQSISGGFEGRAGSGSIDVDFISSGDVEVSTGSGSVRLAGVEGALSARAGSGSITVEGQPSGNWNLSSGSGTVRLRLPPEADFRLDARAGSGGISSDHPLTIRGTVERNRLQGQAGDGGPLITARTGSGGIRIE